MVGIGLISYSTYLWHQPLFAFAKLNSFSEPLLISILATILGWLSWKYIEAPFRNTAAITTKYFLLSLAAALILINSIALVIIFNDGFINRYSPHDHDLVNISHKKQKAFVNARYQMLHLKDFDNTNNTKLLIIGDSYGQDLVNSLYETGISDNVNVSTYYIAKRCGNLLLKYDFSKNIIKRHRGLCKHKDWYNNEKLQRLMIEADVILLASRWLNWVAELLPESIKNIRELSNAKIIILGGKNFGPINIKKLLAINIDKRHVLKNQTSEIHYDINNHMQSLFGKDVFINTHFLLCGDSKKCPVFTGNLKLISYDGRHLTKAGAKFLGQKLATHPLIINLTKIPAKHEHE